MQNTIHRPPSSLQRSADGFTLIELMIGLVVVAILAAVAMPTFMDSIRKGRRSEAFSALATMQQAQERWRSNNPTYTTTLANLGVGSTTSSGNYSLSVDPPSANPADLATGYIVTAAGIAAQASDAQCRKLSVLVDRGSVKYAGCANCVSFTYSTQDPCWKQ